MSKPSIPKGTRDFGPTEMIRRNYIFDTIQSVFKKYGYMPIETPAQENLTTLLGKYGDEGDRLLFRILNSGNYLDKVEDSLLHEKNAGRLTKEICEKGLRYDLTVPFARYVVQHRNDITLPFKRYQIQPVWRADRPQKGRYREFYQCDVDAVGTDSLLMEVELIEIACEVFEKLGIKVTILLNNRKILAGIAEIIGIENRLTDLTVAIDKLDKIGEDGVLKELKEKGFSEKEIEKTQPFLSLSSVYKEKDNLFFLQKMEELLENSAMGKKGIQELKEIFALIPPLSSTIDIAFSPELARGLGYYTGCIMEIKAKDIQIGSIGGGGRYDNLTGIFGLEGVSGVGLSFGADRIYDVLDQLGLFPSSLSSTCEILFINFGKEETVALLPLLRQLRKAGRSAFIYPDAVKLKKQFSYADTLSIPYIVVAGSEEIKEGNITLKNMVTGEQEILRTEEFLSRFGVQ